jgi:hypothetical protein
MKSSLTRQGGLSREHNSPVLYGPALHFTVSALGKHATISKFLTITRARSLGT